MAQTPTAAARRRTGGGPRPQATVDVNKPIFIGGGGEGYTVFGQDLTDAVEPYIRRRPGGGNFFTHWDDGKVKGAIRATHAAGRPVILIGHSWGGSDAIGAAKWAKDNELPIALLVTIDPVGQPWALVWSMEAYRDIARHWVTVIATKPGVQAGDLVANAWGKTPMDLQNMATSVINDVNAGHADFGHMMRTAQAEALIAAAYRRAAGR